MRKYRYYFIVKYIVAGLSIGLLLIIVGAVINYYRGFQGSFVDIFKYSPDFIVILISPVLLSLFLGFIGFRREQLIQLNKKIKESLFKEQTNHSATDQQLKLLANAVAQVNEAIVISDVYGNVQWINDGFTKINGYLLDEIKGKQLDILYGPLTNKEAVANINERVAKGKAAVQELLTYHKDGRTLWLSISIKPIFDASGEIEKFISIQSNITKRREKEIAVDSLYKEVSDYKFALDQSAIVIRFNIEGKIIHVNNKFCEINELPKEELIGKDYRAINISLRDKSIIKPIWQTISSGNTWKGELVNRNRNGKTYWADTTIVPLLDSFGKPHQFLAIQQDITERKQLENQVISNKNKLHEAMKIARLGSWELDKDGTLSLSNELRQLFNVSLTGKVTREEIINNVHPDDVEQLNGNMSHVRNTLKTVETEFRYFVNEEVHYMVSNNTPLINSLGEYIGSFGTVQDITPAKLAALALTKSEEEKAIVLNNAQTIICIHDLKGKILDMNAAAEKLSGFHKNEIVGLTLNHVLAPEHHGKLKEYLDTINTHQKANGTLQIKTKSGSKKVWLYQNVVYRNNGNVPYVIASAIDITESVKANNEIERQQHFIRQIIDNSPNVIFVINEEKKIVLANKNFGKYYKYNEKSTPLVSSLMPEPNDVFIGDEESIYEMQEGQTVRWEGSKTNIGDNTVSWFSVMNRCFKEKKGKKYVLVYGMDITGRHNVETELLAANELVEKSLKVKDQFISNMSHEIRTPLNAVIGFNDLLSDTVLNEEQAGYVDIVKTASANLLSLINNILDLSKIESSNLLLENLPLDISRMMKDIIKILEPKAKMRGLKIKVSIDSKLPQKVMGDQLRLNQVFFNLIGNAIKFTDEGSIYVTCKTTTGPDASKEYITFSVKDTGIGVPLDKQAEIFERFTQANTNTQRLYGGTGLGLNIAKSIIDLYEGTLAIESEPGVGTIFYFTIPFNKYVESKNVSKEKVRKVDNIVSNQTNKPIHILLAEDNSINAMLATQVLTNKGFTLQHVANGELAVEAVKKQYFDLILMDIQMPVMNGINASKAIRQLNGSEAKIPIIAMTAHSLHGEMENCYEAGMNGYVAKPFKPDDLFTAIVDATNNKAKAN